MHTALLHPIEQMTVTEAVAQRLISLLSKGAIKPGDKLPPERDLAAQLNVGRTTVREALKLLTLSGLLEAKRGDGTYVRQEFTSFLSQQIDWPVLLSATEIDLILEVRQPLEEQAARLAAERATPQEIENMTVYRELLEIQGRDIERETLIDLNFHQAVASASHNELLSRLMGSLRSILNEYITLSNKMTDTLQSTLSEHQAVYDAIIARDPDQAQQAMRTHMVLSKRWILRYFTADQH
jgi:GntR family transcriptional regulator, transcriptional repressor for pyruvate dehydrogenase complex